MLTLNDGRSELWQWDTGRKLTVDADCSQVHFSNKIFGRSIDVDVVDGVAIVPDILLQTDKDLNVWAFVGTAENGYTKISKTFKVNRRNKPAEYVFTPTEQETLAGVVARLDAIEQSQDPDAIKNAVEDYLEENPFEAPVRSVNGKIGEVELTAEDVGAISRDDLQEATSEALAQAKAAKEAAHEAQKAAEDCAGKVNELKAENAELKDDLDDYNKRIIGIESNQFPYPYPSNDEVSKGVRFTKIGRKLNIQGETTAAMATYQFHGTWGATDNNPLKNGETYYLSGADSHTTLAFFDTNGIHLGSVFGILNESVKFTVPNNASGANFYWQSRKKGELINVVVNPAIFKADTSIVEQMRDMTLSRNSIEIDDLIIDNAYASEHTVIDVPNNRIVRVGTDIVNLQEFGLPIEGHGTLLKYRPFDTEDTTTGFTVYIYTALSGSVTKQFFAYAMHNQIAKDLIWHEYTNKDDIKNIQRIEPCYTIIVNTAYAQDHTVIDVPNNTIVKVENDLEEYESFGLPQRGYGTLLKYRPYHKDDVSTGFTVYEYTVLEHGNYLSRWYTYAIDGQTVEKLKWRRVSNSNERYDRGINGLGNKSLSIVFIGDSIVEGYGCSNYNGGTNGTSGHLIPNNVKTWYRNTGNKCWANKMISYLIETYPNVKACNNAIGGFNTYQLYENLDSLTLDDDGNRANVAIISIGTNDRNTTNKKVSISDYIVKIIDWMRDRNIQPIVFTNTPFLNGSKGNNPESVHRAIINGCENADCYCYSLLPTLNRYIWEHKIPVEASSDQTKLLHDYLHPSDILYEIMFELIKEILSI